jgi:hypothetical protein
MHNVLILIFILFSCQPVMKKFVALGTECLEFKAAANEAKLSNPMFFNHSNCCLVVLSCSDTSKHEASLGTLCFR